MENNTIDQFSDDFIVKNEIEFHIKYLRNELKTSYHALKEQEEKFKEMEIIYYKQKGALEYLENLARK